MSPVIILSFILSADYNRTDWLAELLHILINVFIYSILPLLIMWGG